MRMQVEGAAQARAYRESVAISAVVPTHNRADLLVRAIESIRQQTIPVSEIIVVDDANDERTRDAVKRFDDLRIKYVAHDVARGGSAARNTGVSTATGSIIAFLDDDDTWIRTKLEIQLSHLGDSDACVSGYCYVGRSGARCPIKRLWHKKDFVPRNIFPTSTLMVRKRAIKGKLFDEQLEHSQDWDALLILSEHRPIINVRKILSYLDAGSHPRITTRSSHNGATGERPRSRFVEKHREFRGTYWSRYGQCERELNYLINGEAPYKTITRAIKDWGYLMTAHAVIWRIADRIRQYLTYAAHTALVKKSKDIERP